MKKLIVFSLLAIGLLSAAAIRQNDKYFEILKNLDIFATMYKEVNANYVDDLNPNTLMRTGIDAMLGSLDPYTVYYSEDQIEDVRTENTGQFGGIGAVIGERDGGKVVVVLPNEGYPAQKAGLKRGDEIIAINGIDVKNDYDKASLYLRGQSSSSINLKVLRPGEGPLDFKVDFERIELPNVPYSGMVDAKVGYIKLTGFREDASKEVKNALRELKKEGAEKIILDLRDNGGGLLNEAVNISNIFIDKGQLVVTTKGKLEEMNATYNALNAATDTEIPLAVLINSSSASASEIVAGVMQDYDRGILVGRKSYGKGLVQRTLPLSYNSQMKVTIAKYYTPSGRCIQAIDYSSRNPDGSVGKIADSLKTAFRTENGRPVYDGGGIDPDVQVERPRLSPVAIGLLKEDLIFKFANQYSGAVPQIQNAQSFELPEKLYLDFKKWVSDKTFSYSSPLQTKIDELKVAAERYGETDKIGQALKQLEAALSRDVQSDMEKSKEEIKYLIKEEFAMRQHLERGQIEASFSFDNDLKRAIQLLNNPIEYNKILSGR
ncbi:S41 family peptidase [Roseivirga sp. UBA838]|uniref:S41 family peptidase n=3 Tax=unclassified Roseivirga TaxID=2626142 RepID=UPI00257E312A|nr:S41 family peptidase [Roseivirga sp. UBA838]MEC7755056.1 S41 family peptidase [Bacteroidota bacterium]|tara:strand:- start:2146 stop:3786 length:1641 start_codon:yes stop_codon:yes gene_type:complete